MFENEYAKIEYIEKDNAVFMSGKKKLTTMTIVIL